MNIATALHRALLLQAQQRNNKHAYSEVIHLSDLKLSKR